MKSFYSIILLLLISSIGFSQISVVSFEKKDNDLDARVNFPVRDQNGDICALIKVETTQNGFIFEGGSLGIMKTEKKTGEYWVYIPWGSKRITIKHPQLGVLRDYTFPINIQKSTVYIMKLTTGKVTVSVEEPEIKTEWILIESNPSNAQVYVNEKPVGKTPFSGEFDHGKHQFRIELPMYHSYAGIFTLDDNSGKQKITADLKPNFGSIYVSSSPEDGAQIIIDGMPTGEKTPFTLTEIKSGDHRISLKHDLYYDIWSDITVSDNKTTEVNLNMKPAFGEINIVTEPEADIYVNNQKVGTGNQIVRKTSGYYTIDAKKDKHTNDSKKILINDGDKINITLSPTPQYGQLKINSTPFEAEIYLNGEYKDKTPATIKNLLVGEYEIELKKDDYITLRKNITINNNETTDINEILENGISVNINTNPEGALIKINEINEGTTPYNGKLIPGKHKIKVEFNDELIEKEIIVKQNATNNFNYEFAPKMINDKIVVQDKTLGGPKSAFYSLLVPGLGVKFVAPERSTWYIRTLYTYALIGAGIYYKIASNKEYKNYHLATEQDKMDYYYRKANDLHTKFYINLAAGIAAWVFDITWVAIKGYNNKKIQNKPNLSLYYEPNYHVFGLSYNITF